MVEFQSNGFGVRIGGRITGKKDRRTEGGESSDRGHFDHSWSRTDAPSLALAQVSSQRSPAGPLCGGFDPIHFVIGGDKQRGAFFAPSAVGRGSVELDHPELRAVGG